MVHDSSQVEQQAGVSIVIPAYNEEKGIGPVLQALLQTMAASGLVWEVIVVDDGSVDETAVTAEAEAVTVIRHPTNQGYGAALKTGIRQAQYDLICITDADGTYPNDRIPDLVVELHNGRYDMVVGARTGEDVSIPLLRRPPKWILRKLANFVASSPIPDLNSGLRVFRREVILRFFGLLPNKFSFTTTITLAMLTNQYLVRFLPINYYARIGRSKIRPIHDTINFVQLVLRIALYFAPLKIFLPLSLMLFVTGVAWGTFTKLYFGVLADVSTLVIVMTAFQAAMVGMLAELINRRVPNSYVDSEK
jgi:glycosyltransferase involved in cell wall biosynthesis